MAEATSAPEGPDEARLGAKHRLATFERQRSALLEKRS